MAGPKNAVIAQSGGPTPVINNSLRGVIDAIKQEGGTFGKIYAGWHGVEGILKEDLLDLSAQSTDEIALLRTTPTAGTIGTCRYKLKDQQEEDFDRIIEVFKAHDIGYFYYIGGNDSMDTANKISMLAAQRGLDLVATGVPKTIDNDVGDSDFELIDHTPGYGSVARYWATMVQNANEENKGSSPADPVLVLQAMGRRIGFIPAAARLADPKREMPLLIYMNESNVTIGQIAHEINDMVKRRKRALVVVGEGLSLGDIGQRRDSFGHTEFGASQITASQVLVNYLNDKGLPVSGSARGQVAGTDQRGAIQLASPVDLEEAYRLGQKAVDISVNEGSGYMSTITRKPGPIYCVDYGKVPLDLVANSERTFPDHWIADSRSDVRDDFLAYAQPLIGEDLVDIPMVNGLMRFARLEPIFVDKKLTPYMPQGYR